MLIITALCNNFRTFALNTVVWWRELGEVENECTSHNFSFFAQLAACSPYKASSHTNVTTLLWAQHWQRCIRRRRVANQIKSNHIYWYMAALRLEHTILPLMPTAPVNPGGPGTPGGPTRPGGPWKPWSPGCPVIPGGPKPTGPSGPVIYAVQTSQMLSQCSVSQNYA